MTTQHFPEIDAHAITETKDALHAYAAILGAWLKTCRHKRKHWWHASLRPSLSGLTSGVIHGGVDVELELNMRESLLQARASNGELLTEELRGQPAADLAERIQKFMLGAGIETSCIPQGVDFKTKANVGYDAEQACKLGRAINAASAAMDLFRANIREETSPIQLWPHHFDLSMLWLPGEKIAGQDPKDEENSDKQLNFGFTFGDDGIAEPYFYVTAYPLPDEFPNLSLPDGTLWRSDGFSGAVLLYRDLLQSKDPKSYLINLWTQLLSAGQEHMLDHKN